MTTIEKWAKDWGVHEFAITDLVNRMHDMQPGNPKTEEAVVQQELRLDASRQGARLWRNNNGAAQDRTGRMIRYGLGNDSAKVNRHLKSSDLIGITPVHITPDLINTTMGVFTSIEVKKGSWVYKGTERELAQANWLNLVTLMGGIAMFANKKEDIHELSKR